MSSVKWRRHAGKLVLCGLLSVLRHGAGDGYLCPGCTRDHALVVGNQVGSDHTGDHVELPLPSYKPNLCPAWMAEAKLYVWYGRTNRVKRTFYDINL